MAGRRAKPDINSAVLPRHCLWMKDKDQQWNRLQNIDVAPLGWFGTMRTSDDIERNYTFDGI